jgi:hypothetical protein
MAFSKSKVLSQSFFSYFLLLVAIMFFLSDASNSIHFFIPLSFACAKESGKEKHSRAEASPARHGCLKFENLGRTLSFVLLCSSRRRCIPPCFHFNRNFIKKGGMRRWKNNVLKMASKSFRNKSRRAKRKAKMLSEPERSEGEFIFAAQRAVDLSKAF